MNSSDIQPQVSILSKKCLLKIKHLLDQDSTTSKFMEIFISLKTTRSESQIQLKCNLLSGYMNLLGKTLSIPISANINLISKSLFQITRFKTSLIQDTSNPFDFLFLLSKTSIDSVTLMCKLLVTCTDAISLVDHFTHESEDNENYEMQTVFCLDAFLQGIIDSKITSQVSFEKTGFDIISTLNIEIRSCIFQHDVIEYLATMILEEYTSISKNKQTIPLIVTSLTRMAHLDVNFDKLVFVILTNESSNEILSRIAINKNTSINEIIKSNFDYISNEIMIRFRNGDLFESSNVLINCLKICDVDFVFYVSELIETCLDLIDENVDVNFFLRVLLEYCNILKVDREPVVATKEIELDYLLDQVDELFNDEFECGDAREFFENRIEKEKASASGMELKDPEIGEQESTLNVSKEEQEPNSKENDQEEPITETIQLTMDIISRILPQAHSKDAKTRQLTIKVLSSALKALKAPHLNISIHKVWPIVISTLSDLPPIISESTRLLTEISRIGKDFVSKRIIDDLMNKLPRVFKMAESGSISPETFKLIIEFLTVLVEHVPLPALHIHEIESLAISFLDGKRGDVYGLMEMLCKVDPDGVWVLLVRYKGKKISSLDGKFRMKVVGFQKVNAIDKVDALLEIVDCERNWI